MEIKLKREVEKIKNTRNTYAHLHVKITIPLKGLEEDF